MTETLSFKFFVCSSMIVYLFTGSQALFLDKATSVVSIDEYLFLGSVRS